MKKILLAVAMMISACSSRGTAGLGASCKITTDCASGEFCVNSVCAVSAGTGGGGSTGSAIGSTGTTPNITAVVVNADTGTFTVQGTNLSSVTKAELSQNSQSVASLSVKSASSTQVVAQIAAGLTLATGAAYDLVVSTASASSPSVSITYTIADGSVALSALSTAGCAANQVATFDGSNWGCATPAAAGPIQTPLVLQASTTLASALEVRKGTVDLSGASSITLPGTINLGGLGAITTVQTEEPGVSGTAYAACPNNISASGSVGIVLGGTCTCDVQGGAPEAAVWTASCSAYLQGGNVLCNSSTTNQVNDGATSVLSVGWSCTSSNCDSLGTGDGVVFAHVVCMTVPY